MTTMTEAVRASSTAAPREARPRRARRAETKRAPPAYYWMVWPAVIAFAAFHTLPVLVGIFFSFTNYAGYGDWNFVGLSNYVNLFKDDRVLHGLRVLVPVRDRRDDPDERDLARDRARAERQDQGAQLLAGRLLRARTCSRSWSSATCSSSSSRTRCRRSSPGIPLFADNILTNETWAWTAIVALARLAGLRVRDHHLPLGAADDPGRAVRSGIASTAPSRGGSSRSITFPLISAFFTINVVLSLKGFLQVFDPIVALTNGGPGTATESVTLLIFRGGFTRRRVRLPDGERGDLLHRDHDRLALPIPCPSAQRGRFLMTTATNTAAQLEQELDAVTAATVADAPRRPRRRHPQDQLVGDRAHRGLLAHGPHPALPRGRRRAQDARRSSPSGTGFEWPNPIRWENFPEAWERTNFPQALANTALITVGLGRLHAADELDRRLRDRPQHPPAVLQGRVLLPAGGAVHPVPDHHAAAREADRDPRARQPGRHDHPVHDLRAVAEHLHLHRLHPLDPDRARGGGADGRRDRPGGCSGRSSSRCSCR